LTNRLHDNEIPIDGDLVRQLIDTQFPQYRSQPLQALDATGSTNRLFRLGPDLLVRLPRQPDGKSIDKEDRWLPILAQHLPVSVPEIVGIGDPGCGYTERWSITRWLDGQSPGACRPEDSVSAERSTLANDLADFILALRETDCPESTTSDPTLDGYRGHTLIEYDDQTRINIQECRSITDLDIDLDAASRIWNEAIELPATPEAPLRCYHGDLVSENLLMVDNRLTAVLDFGELGVEDSTVDLHGAWELFDKEARQIFRTRLEADESEWLRGRAWALAISLSTFTYYWNTMPRRREDRLAMVRNAIADSE
tara:strand:- start:1718 stop:2650 length:933 start_codon:yes stop_codon:yes gene_type:complete